MEECMRHEIVIDDLDLTVDPAGTLELARVSAAVVKTVVKAVSDVIVSLYSR
jgi:hypothetical protein